MLYTQFCLLCIHTFKAFAAFVYSGTRFLQCPHQGAKNSTTQTSSPFITKLSKLLGVSSTTFPLLGNKARQFVAKNAKTVIEEFNEMYQNRQFLLKEMLVILNDTT